MNLEWHKLLCQVTFSSDSQINGEDMEKADSWYIRVGVFPRGTAKIQRGGKL